jgi:hypothetical protein
MPSAVDPWPDRSTGDPEPHRHDHELVCPCIAAPLRSAWWMRIIELSLVDAHEKRHTSSPVELMELTPGVSVPSDQASRS